MIKIHGKTYAEVKDRIKEFRENPKHHNYGIDTKILHLKEDWSEVIVICTIRDEQGRVIADGLAQEDKTSSKINRTSMIENAQTSAIGRALAALGYMVDGSFASAEEVSMAIAKEEILDQKPKQEKKVEFISEESNEHVQELKDLLINSDSIEQVASATNTIRASVNAGKVSDDTRDDLLKLRGLMLYLHASVNKIEEFDDAREVLSYARKLLNGVTVPSKDIPEKIRIHVLNFADEIVGKAYKTGDQQ